MKKTKNFKAKREDKSSSYQTNSKIKQSGSRSRGIILLFWMAMTLMIIFYTGEDLTKFERLIMVMVAIGVLSIVHELK